MSQSCFAPVWTIYRTAQPSTRLTKMVTFRRFPAGPIDWVISGVPRSWFARMPHLAVPGVRYLMREFRGLRPAFYIHLTPPPRNRSLILDREVKRAYYRMACCLELQPEMKDILCAAWFHDPSALRDAPHLAPLNGPHLQWGGRILTSLGPAPPDSGMLKYSPERRKQFDAGALKINLTLAVWPRKAAIDWALNNRDLES
jgi:hypothetical protein